MAASQKNLAQAMTDRERLRMTMETMLHEAEHNLEVTRAELSIVTEQNAIAQESLRLSRKAFTLGEIDLVAMMRNQALAYDAERALTSKQIQLQWDTARYNQAVGVLP
jgi:outer membrane protein TolC